MTNFLSMRILSAILLFFCLNGHCTEFQSSSNVALLEFDLSISNDHHVIDDISRLKLALLVKELEGAQPTQIVIHSKTTGQGSISYLTSIGMLQAGSIRDELVRLGLPAKKMELISTPDKRARISKVKIILRLSSNSDQSTPKSRSTTASKIYSQQESFSQLSSLAYDFPSTGFWKQKTILSLEGRDFIRTSAASTVSTLVSRQADKLPDFSDYPALISSSKKTARLDTTSHPLANRYRSILSEALAQGPNFSGTFTISSWGCGAGCMRRAIIDTTSGKIFIPKQIEASWHSDQCNYHREYIRYRLDSKLLLAITTHGNQVITTAYFWTGKNLSEIGKKIQSMNDWCSE